MSIKDTQNIFIIELNEFNIDLLKHAAEQHVLPAISKLLSLTQSSYKTQDRYNSGYLEPWVQWTSIHTGTPASIHKMKYLQDVMLSQKETCWDIFNKHGISTGVWGAIHAPFNAMQNTLFSFPNAWAAAHNQKASPSALQPLFDLAHSLIKEQAFTYRTFLKKLFPLLKCFMQTRITGILLKETRNLFSALKRFNKQPFAFLCYLDLISTYLFIEQKQKTQPRCAFLFLDALANLQHTHWQAENAPLSPEMLFGLENLDKILALLWNAFPDDAIVVHNGLSQMNTQHEKPCVTYRQKDPITFFKTLGLPLPQVIQNITPVVQTNFQNSKDSVETFNAFRAARIQNKPLFQLAMHATDPCVFYYELKFSELVDENIIFECNGMHLPLLAYFEKTAIRTGRHVPIGTVLSNTIVFPDHIDNHDFNTYLYHYLLPEQFALREENEERLLDIEEIEA